MMVGRILLRKNYSIKNYVEISNFGKKERMSNQLIEEMIAYEEQSFRFRRIYYSHNYSLFDDRGVLATAIYIPESK